jgi:putative ABC transport system permease protein
MVLRQSFVLVAIGIGIGLLASIGLTRVLQGLLFGIKATDSLAFAVVVAILMISALVACLLPAERAANADPVVALRME